MTITIEFLSGTQEGRTEVFDEDQICLGRGPTNTFVFPAEDEPLVSVDHVKVFRDGTKWYVEDLGSTNGTYLDGRTISGRAEVHRGSEVSLGRKGPRFRISLEPPKTVLEPAATVLEAPRQRRDLDEVPEAVHRHDVSKKPVGAKTVFQMIDSASARARQTTQGRFRRGTVFIQEVVGMAVRESTKKLKLAVAAFAMVSLALAALLVYQKVAFERETRAVKEELIAKYEKGLGDVRGRLEAQRNELESRKKIYQEGIEKLQRELNAVVGERESSREGIDRLSSQLQDSQARSSQLARELGALRAEQEQVRQEFLTGQQAAEDELDVVETRLSEVVEEYSDERAHQQELLQQYGEQLTEITRESASDEEEVKQLVAQLGAAGEDVQRFESKLGELEARVTEAEAGQEAKVREFRGDLEEESEFAVLSAMADLERGARPAAAAAPWEESAAASAVPVQHTAVVRQDTSTVGPPVAGPAAVSQVRLSRPYPRARLKKRLSLGRFECLVPNIPWGVSRADVERQLAAQMTTLLNQTGAFTVLERSDLDQVLGEQQLGQTGVINRQTAVTPGRLLGAQALVIGKITQMDNELEAKKSTTDWGGMFNALASVAGAVDNSYTPSPSLSNLDLTTTKQTVTSTFTLHIDLKVIDTTSGEVLFTTTGHGHATTTRKGTAFGTRGIEGAIQLEGNDDVADGTRQALLDTVIKLLEGMEGISWKGRVMDFDQGRVILNAGEDFNIQVGDTFQVVSRGKELIDPDTGQSRGFIESQAGTVRVSQVDSNKSFADIVERSLEFKKGDGLLYLGMTKVLAPGENPDMETDLATTGRAFPYAVIASTKPRAFGGPGENFGEIPLADLEKGSPVRVKFAFGDWVKVILPRGSSAWMKGTEVQLKEGYPTKITSVRVAGKRGSVFRVPCSKSKRIARLKNGAVADVEDKLGDWFLVVTSKGHKGWIRQSEVTEA